MQKELNIQDMASNDAANTQADPAQDKSKERPKLKRNGLKEEFKKKGEDLDKEQAPPMSKEDTIKFYEENLPFMRLQDEFEEIKYKFDERRIKNLELRVRELEAVGFLGQWKAQQDDAQRRHDQEQKMKEEWGAMTPEQQEEHRQRAKANLRIMELQAKSHIIYDGTNAGDIVSFVDGEFHGEMRSDSPDRKYCFHIPKPATKEGERGGYTEICVLPGQTLTRTEAGEFIVS